MRVSFLLLEVGVKQIFVRRDELRTPCMGQLCSPVFLEKGSMNNSYQYKCVRSHNTYNRNNALYLFGSILFYLRPSEVRYDVGCLCGG